MNILASWLNWTPRYCDFDVGARVGFEPNFTSNSSTNTDIAPNLGQNK